VLIDFNEAPEGASLSADICIVGAGAAGITLAMELIPTRKRIILVEGGDLKYSEESQSLYHMARDRWYWDPAETRLRFFGGTTNHWEGSCRPFDPIDFEHRPWVADSGWPFSYYDLEPYYDRAYPYVELGERYRNERPLLRHLDAYWQKMEAGGFNIRLAYSSPPTRFGQKYLEALRTAPNVTILTRANLVSIDEAADRQSVASLTIANYKRRKATIAAAYYVIALGGIEKARALLLSDAVTPGGIGNERDLVGRYFMDHPVVEAVVFYPIAGFMRAWDMGIANSVSLSPFLQASEDLLRRNQLTNARMPLAWATKSYTSQGIESTHQIEKALATGRELPEILTHLRNVLGDADLILEQWRRQHGFKPMVNRADEYGGYVMQMMMEQRPDRANRIILTDERDALGLRKGRVAWRLPQSEKDELKRLIAFFAKGMGAQGLGVVRSFLSEDDTDRRFEDVVNFGAHHMGTTRASVDPKRGVVDGDQRIHGRGNIYMAGSSVFPTGSHVPPTTTIVATTIRLADHLKKRLA
jgi:choline dehydrogenase-like flavoprotein